MLTGVHAILDQSSVESYCSNPINPLSILSNATIRLVYDAFAYYRTKTHPEPQPAVSATIFRETHVSDLTGAAQTRVQQSFEYLDGHGRTLQKKKSADPDPTTNAARWISTGWAVLNNKGNPVKNYEPFFTGTSQYEANISVGVSSTIFYDPIQRIIGTLNPDHTWSKKLFDCWTQQTWDQNDTVRLDAKSDEDIGSHFGRLKPEEYLPSWYDGRIADILNRKGAEAATKSAVNAGTPDTIYLDCLGRSIAVVTHLKSQRSTETVVTEDFRVSKVEYDTNGEVRRMIDSRDRLTETRDYYMAGRVIHTSNMESGEVWSMISVIGVNVSTWGTRGYHCRNVYDEIGRPTRIYMQGDATPEVLYSEIFYGDSQPQPEDKNLRGKVVRTFDQSGARSMDKYDFKGNLLNASRNLARKYDGIQDWMSSEPLEPETFTATTAYDALNRPISETGPDKSATRTTYNMAGFIQSLDVNLQGAGTWHPYVLNVDYDAHGRRTVTDYANGAITTHTFDPLTFRIASTITARKATDFPGDCVKPAPAGWPGCQVQNLQYTYDALGNVTYVRDDAQQTVYFQNRRVEPSNDYTYDSFNQLIEASGREHLSKSKPVTAYGPFNSGLVGLHHPNDGNAMGTYVESYYYDDAGNMTTLQHRGSSSTVPDWSRKYFYEEQSLLDPSKYSNRLSYTTVGGVTERYQYDGDEGRAGCMTSMPHLSLMKWDLKRQLQASATQVSNLGTPETTWYVYDSNGERVRKVIVSQATTRTAAKRLSECIYLGGLEIYRKYKNDGTSISVERQTVHLNTGPRVVTLVETITKGTDPSGVTQVSRIQFGNHLTSACLELDDQSRILSYEEYTPYGSTSYQAVASQNLTPKRYRFCGKERDKESGFYFYGARYYTPWLGRWISPDPKGGGDNLYVYVLNNPVRFTDPDGRDPKDAGDDWVELPSTPAYGVLAHAVGLPVLSERVMAQLKVPAAPFELLTNPGGSKTPFSMAKGRIDLGILTLDSALLPGFANIQVYDLRAAGDLRDAWVKTGETLHYSDFVTDVVADHTILEARPGTILGDLEFTSPAAVEKILEPHEFMFNGEEHKITFELPYTEYGHAVPGVIFEKLYKRRKKKQRTQEQESVVTEKDKQRLNDTAAMMTVNVRATVGGQAIVGARAGQIVGGVPATVGATAVLAAPAVVALAEETSLLAGLSELASLGKSAVAEAISGARAAWQAFRFPALQFHGP